MATPMSPDDWIKALRAEGVTDIVEMPGWRTNNRNGRGPWGPVYATMIHHTAGEGSGLPSLVFNGTAELPGPLCHDYLDRTGRLYLVGNGRANHAGRVAQNATAAVRNERPVHPAPGPDALDGNAFSYGLECENSGAVGRAWPARQYDVAVRVQAARCRFHGWTENSVWAHKEATTRKPVDPRLPMDAFRADVAERLRHPASWNPSDTPTPTPPKEDDMDPFDVWAYKGSGESTDAYAYLRGTSRNLATLTAKVDALTAVNVKLVDTVAQLVAGIGDLDPAAIVTELRESIESIEVRLDVPDPTPTA